METANQHTENSMSILTVAASVLLSVIGLGYFDRELKKLSGLFPQLEISLIIYLLPVVILTHFIYTIFIRKNPPTKRHIASVLIGVPVSFLSTLLLFNYLA